MVYTCSPKLLTKRVLGSDLVNLLTGPHGVDRYTELLAPTWTRGEGRAKVVEVRRTTPRSVTLVLAPNDAFADTGQGAGSTSTSPSRSTAAGTPAATHRPTPRAPRISS